ncbi:MAG: peptide chain release factor N(5)-glutamine methyltransferase [Alcanivoracaceae bacterium]|nr:peptide chain release factor N(5)-glutamine methyltransferase [Alcanivoracaceae bacterium]
MKTISAALQQARQRLKQSDSAALDAELLLCHVLGKPRSYLFTWPEQQLDDSAAARFDQLLDQRQAGRPVAYLLGRREFYGHEFLLSEDTLIPRPDTELLVDLLLEKLPADTSCRVADLGTGSGAIAISAALARPHWQVLAVDYLVSVLDMVERNVQRLKANNVTPLQSNWYEKLDGLFHAIVSNPPYIRHNDKHLSRGDVRFEPRSALVAGEDGLDDIRLIVAKAPQYLQADGLLAVEHGYDQRQAVRLLFAEAGFEQIETRRDYGDNDRVTFGFCGANHAQ